jgi:hypothetical protein
MLAAFRLPPTFSGQNNTTACAGNSRRSRLCLASGFLTNPFDGKLSGR